MRYLATDGDSGIAGLYGEPKEFPEQKVLYRNDTQTPLSVVGSRYQVVQPRQVLEFYRDLTEVAGYELETAGVLKGGRKFWALARTGKSIALKAKDVVNGYLLLATSCDGTLATVAMPTTVRVVCNNTLGMALRDGVDAVKVPHSRAFDARAVKRQLGVAVGQWDSFMYRMKTLSERKVKSHEAMNYFLKVICNTDQHAAPSMGLTNERALKKVQTLYDGHGRGAEMHAAKDTAWGLLCAVTEFVDHEKQARSQDNRLDSAWFGQGAVIKQRALEHALQLVA
ncbi:UNVERIFIED_ORG: phage/plasmid-like protein (TIGR03299 family) [Comamonas terrigena]